MRLGWHGKVALAAIAAASAVVALAVARPAGLSAAALAEAERTLAAKNLAFPVRGYRNALQDTFDETRGTARHEALDIIAPRGTAVIAVDDGKVAKLFTSVPGGLTVYLFDPTGKLAYYYAHMDRYAPGLEEGASVERGQVIGYVGSTGNAAPNAPHLHFTVYALGPGREWWKGVALNAYPQLSRH
jgi:murein DD-endopeptidase MepM/ murein hydrolase activator NlpD